MIGLYNNELFNAFKKENKIKISKRGKRNGFLIKKINNEFFSFILVDNEELEELYDIKFYVEWRKIQFECGCSLEKNTVFLRHYDDYKIAKKFDFLEYDRGCFYKEVSIDECSKFMYKKIDYLKNYKEKKCEVVKAEFLKIYKKNVDDLK